MPERHRARQPRRNRVDPFGDLHATAERGLFTGNRGCLLDDAGGLARHHRGSLWILCRTSYRGWSHPLDQPGTWTPLFFLDDAVGLAAGHRPCGLCRRDDYLAYSNGVAVDSDQSDERVEAAELNRRLGRERLRRGRGIERRDQRLVHRRPIDELPTGTVILHGPADWPHLVVGTRLAAFSFAGWESPIERPTGSVARVLTPPTSVSALIGGFEPTIAPVPQLE